MGFTLEYEEGVDKFIAGINNKYVISKNQNGTYIGQK